MAESATALLLWLVALLLAIGVARQFAVSGRIGLLLDRLTIVPQWKFFGQSAIASDAATFDDLHLLARHSADGSDPDWQPLLWRDERRWSETVWNPGLRRLSILTEAMLHLVHNEAAEDSRLRPTALSYLTVLRVCLDGMPVKDGDAIQFAIVQTSGRSDADSPRPLTLRFLSAWHSP